ncbi:MAG TPA: pyridoxamine 5'-phosphate oxidase family protein [Spirochaetota bacterium]|nr:pyridoxamine 5'-phosphate oxidase family protein [Spirochaetota bacterium]
MRRKEREIKDLQEIEDIIEKSDVCRIALSDNDVPYIVTMNFGFRKGANPCLFFHCAKEGKKIDMIKCNNLACFQFDIDHALGKTEVRCNCGMKYRSVVGTGKISFVTEREQKIEALGYLMHHYVGGHSHQFEEKNLEGTTVLRLDIDEISGKKCV